MVNEGIEMRLRTLPRPADDRLATIRRLRAGLDYGQADGSSSVSRLSRIEDALIFLLEEAAAAG